MYYDKNYVMLVQHSGEVGSDTASQVQGHMLG